jgi:hypothetical protein
VGSNGGNISKPKHLVKHNKGGKNMNDDTAYVNKQEDKCSRLLYQLNDKMHWFTQMTPNQEKSIIDFTCYDRYWRKCHVELKQRNANIDTFPTILLDTTKLQHWTKIGESGATNNEQRLYFNFMNDGVIIHNLNDIKHMEFYPNHKQYNPAKQRYEYRDKIGLSVKDAIVYKYTDTGQLIRQDMS